jgi:hypothetical protein
MLRLEGLMLRLEGLLRPWWSTYLCMLELTPYPGA